MSTHEGKLQLNVLFMASGGWTTNLDAFFISKVAEDKYYF